MTDTNICTGNCGRAEITDLDTAHFKHNILVLLMRISQALDPEGDMIKYTPPTTWEQRAETMICTPPAAWKQRTEKDNG